MSSLNNTSSDSNTGRSSSGEPLSTTCSNGGNKTSGGSSSRYTRLLSIMRHNRSDISTSSMDEDENDDNKTQQTNGGNDFSKDKENYLKELDNNTCKCSDEDHETQTNDGNDFVGKDNMKYNLKELCECKGLVCEGKKQKNYGNDFSESKDSRLKELDSFVSIDHNDLPAYLFPETANNRRKMSCRPQIGTQGDNYHVKINHSGLISGNNSNNDNNNVSQCYESEEEEDVEDSGFGVDNDYFVKVMDQLNTFYQRVKACSYTQSLLPYQTPEMSVLGKLEGQLDRLRTPTSASHLNEGLCSFSRVLQGDVNLSSSFLSNFLNSVQSVLELDGELTSVTELLQIFVPFVNAVLKSTGVREHVISSIQNDNLLHRMYHSIASTFSRESRYSSKSVGALLGFQCGEAERGGRITKAHIVRMTPRESKAAFQDTFGDGGNQTDVYLIYVWQVFKVYEVRNQDDDSQQQQPQPLVVSLMDDIERTGKYLSILRAKELQAKEHSDPFATHLRDKPHNHTLKDDAQKSVHPVPEANFEWTDFRLGRVNANGVAFLVNSSAWVSQLEEISADVEKLAVKKKLKDVPSLGLTLALKLKSGISILDPQSGGKEEVALRLAYIRVRVVCTAGPVVRVYGVDTGTVHTCPDPRLLVLIPPSLIQYPPCGRLARLPVMPCPASSHLAPQLALLVALCQRPDMAQNLCAIDLSPTTSWLQVRELTQLTLHLLETLLDTLPNSHLLPNISLIIADYLLRGTGGSGPHHLQQPSPCTNLAMSILTTAMTTSPKIRLMLAKEGLFVTLCELGLNGDDCPQAWESLLTLLGGRTQVQKWTTLNRRATSNAHHHNNNRHHHHQPFRSPSEPKSMERSQGILHLATMATRDRSWDLEIRHTLTTRQLYPYHSHGGWQWDKAEVVTSDVGKLHHGHLLSVRSDGTHHLILDKCVSNIRMNTLLQVILGMLNNGVGGKVYIGLSEAGVVQGVRMTREQRDCFMLGFSKLVTSEVTPSLLPCDSLIQMVPVLRPATSLSPHINHGDYFIIVLTVRPQPGLVYRCRDDPVPVIVRGEGGATTTLRGTTLTRTLARAQTSTRALQQKVASEKENLLKVIMEEGKARQQ